MVLLGCHVSIEGGVQNAPPRGSALGCEAIQIFTRNQRQWKSKPLLDEQIEAFKAMIIEHKIQAVVTHSIYLVNLASADKSLQKQSELAFLDEMDRCEALGIPFLVFHPGSYRGNKEKRGIQQLVKSLQKLLSKRPSQSVILLIENTAGAGSLLGSSVEQIAEIRDLIGYPNRVKVCLDTSHAFAAGYNLRGAEGINDLINQIKENIGLEHLKAFHLNDSQSELGSRRDRHENIGLGQIGIACFESLVNDPRFQECPMILETPGGNEWFRKNLKLLFELRKS